MPKPNTSFPSVQPFAHFHYLKQQQLQKQQGGRDADSVTGTAVHLPPTADEGSPEEREEAGAAMTATTGAFERRGDSILEVGGAIADPIELGATSSGVSTCNDGGLSVRANLLVPS